MTLGRFALFLLAAVAYPAAAASAATHYVVAFNQPNGLPNNVDKLIADAGGTIAERIPEIGGVGVLSDNPDFLAKVKANAQVKAADLALEVNLDHTWMRNADVGAQSSTNNGGNFSPPAPIRSRCPTRWGTSSGTRCG